MNFEFYFSVFFSGVFNVICNLSLFIGNVRVGRVLHHSMLRNMLSSPMRFFDSTPSGRILNRFGRDFETIDQLITHNIHYLLWCSLEIVAMVIAISMSVPIILTVMFPLAIIYITVQVSVCLLIAHFWHQKTVNT